MEFLDPVLVWIARLTIVALFAAAGLSKLLQPAAFRDAVVGRQASWRTIVRTAVDLGIPVLALSASLGYFDAYRTARLPANLTQAQRDYFGAHTYKRVDRPGVFHTAWQAADH